LRDIIFVYRIVLDDSSLLGADAGPVGKQHVMRSTRRNIPVVSNVHGRKRCFKHLHVNDVENMCKLP